MKLLLFLFCLFCSVSTLISQDSFKGSVRLTNETSLEGTIRLDYEQQQVFVTKNYQESTYDLSRVAQVTLKNTVLEKQVFEDQIYFSNELVKGKATLYQVNTDEYLIVKEDGSLKKINLQEQQNTIPGILAVVFNDCNSIRTTLNNIDEYNRPNLKEVVSIYNKCEYTAFTPTEREAKNAAILFTDQATFYIGAGGGVNSTRFFNMGDWESNAFFQGQLGVSSSPSFLGNLQGNLYASLEGQVAIASDQNFSNVTNAVNFSQNSYRVLLGLDYIFNKKNKLKPFLGISAGITSDNFEGSVDGNNFKIDGGNPIVVPKIGFKYLLSNGQHIGLVVSYITGFENDLTFPTEEEIIPLIVNTKAVSLGINYYF